mmetsp:Transcript_83811/g.135854  ORF Transcript_83811/g.135854 Transcript_83811/m.135854 type:complete len:127 (-) Transcript_83811:219-599(-)
MMGTLMDLMPKQDRTIPDQDMLHTPDIKAYFRLAGEQRGSAISRTPPQKSERIRTWTVAGVGTSKSGAGTDKAVHAILSSSLTQVLQPFLTSSCPRPPHHQLPHCSDFLTPYFFTKHFGCFWFISS